MTTAPTPGQFQTPPFWASTWNAVLRLVNGPPAAPRSPGRDSLILDAAVALRAGRVDDAAALLAPHAAALARDTAYLNLFGVACELRHEWRLARRFYGVAISVDPAYPPAQQNMRRLYELDRFGRSNLPPALGDAELRRNRTLYRTHDND